MFPSVLVSISFLFLFNRRSLYYYFVRFFRLSLFCSIFPIVANIYWANFNLKIFGANNFTILGRISESKAPLSTAALLTGGGGGGERWQWRRRVSGTWCSYTETFRKRRSFIRRASASPLMSALSDGPSSTPVRSKSPSSIPLGELRISSNS